MKTLTFDTETQGLPDFKDSWELDYAKFPHIASIAWQVHNDGDLVYEAYHYIKPVGWEMSECAGAVNGLTTEFLHENGMDALSVYRHLLDKQMEGRGRALPE